MNRSTKRTLKSGKSGISFRQFPVFFCIGIAVPLVFPAQTQAQAPADKAWTVLQSGLSAGGGDKVTAVRVLGLIEKDQKAEQLALTALGDSNSEVRAAAAEALGQMQAKSAAPQIETTLKAEQDVGVIVSCARALVALGDPLGFGVYYAVLTGERKSGALLDSQKKMLKDPKKMAQFGFETGIGFVPFASVGLGAFKALTKDDSSPVRAAAARILAKDPDPKTRDALVQATSDKSWLVRAAALDSLSHRNDPSVIAKIEPSLDDEKTAVRLTGAAAIVHLQDVQEHTPETKPISKHK
ncbi:HEAT repeat domain-containing protein [Alloacidobacterium sp.]|uniref:HEAT repeat domain-containing protein n=1 Tax=Alloacidobacterium sp. TaxID=2951999 RepID=UPI002D47B991|nr:HEAT repeat domain-containing protein [Alloacidobacterium sp.]HYK34455.1 HEAT repeat domain-containing protein [Alloacidobacterium sp.]